MFRINILVVFSVIIFTLRSSEGDTRYAYLKTAHIGSVNPGFPSGDCPISSNGYKFGWHFVLSGTKTSFVSIKCVFEKAGSVTTMQQVPTNKHAYVFTPTSDKIRNASAVVDGPDTEFVLSHVCNPGQTTTTAHTVLTTQITTIEATPLIVDSANLAF
ncbi:unnamed protein product, partial [Rotaria sp. Silwood2]